MIEVGEMKIVHVINGLEVGGAERMLVRLATSIQQNYPEVRQVVVSLSGEGVLGPILRQRGVDVFAIDAQSAARLPYAIWSLVRLLKKERPTIVQSWLYRSDLVTSVAARLSGKVRIAWGIRCTFVPRSSSIALKLLIRLNAQISSFLPDIIICCAESAKRYHTALGFDAKKMFVIPNGFDFEDFRPNEESRRHVRKNLGIADDETVIGIVGRFDELKDFGNFIDAAERVLKVNPGIKFMMLGNGVDASNASLYARITLAGLEQNFILLGARDDVATMMRGMDIYCLSSRSEGFPNVVVEAMGTGLPCVVTDVGDSAAIVGPTGKVVPPCDPDKLASALVEFVQLTQSELRLVGEQARERARNLYSLHSVTRTYMELYNALDREVE